MKKHKTSRIILLLFISGFLFNSCTDKDDTPEMEKVKFTFNFIHTVGSEPVEFDTIKYTNTFENNYSVSTLKYFVSDFVFINEEGFAIQNNEVHYVDATDESTLTFNMASKIPVNDFNSISFTFGLNDLKNITGRYLDPPESNMEWPIPMGGGYHYMKLEGKFYEADTVKNYQCHTGPTMGNSNYIYVTLPESSFQASGSEMTFNIQMDINKWFDSPFTLDLNDITGIMGNQTMQLKLQANGEEVFTLESIE